MKQCFLALAAVAALAACSDRPTPLEPVSASVSGVELARRGGSRTGAAFALTNAVAGNAVAVFARDRDGALSLTGTVATGGLGTGGGLSNQGALVLDDERRFLFVVNAGSDDISVLALTAGGPVLRDRVPSGGDRPVSLTLRDNLLYVVNAGSDNIAGFRVSRSGALTPLAGSVRALSGAGTGPAQVSFTPDGNALVVTERLSNKITTFTLGKDGLSTKTTINASHGETPFGFDFSKRGTLFVSEAFGGMPDASAASSYDVTKRGTIEVISGSVPTTETAACWLILSHDGRYAYVANTGSGSVTVYRVTQRGRLERIDEDGRAAETGAGTAPADMALSKDGRFLYVRAGGVAGGGAVFGFAVHGDGTLSPLGSAGGLPAGAIGLVAW
ncbi:MAG: beta-propeller fold lactonase family protein [Gemmatimonadaceae bacterium]